MAGRRVIVLGGTGVFGSRLADLLVRDGHSVRIAGRDGRRAAQVADRLGAVPLVLDRTGDLGALGDCDVVVDCAGPFQRYGEQPGLDPYSLARACIAAGADYLDLSDAAAFTQGIRALDADAQAAGRVVLSGVSSVPALSGAAVAALADGLDEIAVIDTAILPGNRAPRGRSVMISILEQVGRPLRQWRGGAWDTVSGWSDRKRYDLAPSLSRSGYAIGAPDLELFPEAFGARSVLFRAGLDLGLFNRVLEALGWFRRATGLAQGRWTVVLARAVAGALGGAGIDRGGMSVAVIGYIGSGWVRRTWHLVADAGEGPFVPAVPARALIRRLDDLPRGARPCVAELGLREAEAAMSDLAVPTARDERPARPLFEQVLGERWGRLGPHQRRLHHVLDVERFEGLARVDRGQGIASRLIGGIFGFPTASAEVPVQVVKRVTEAGEVWERTFGARRFRSHLSGGPRPGTVIERFGPFAFELALRVEEGRMQLPVARGWVLGLPMPRVLLPLSAAFEEERDGRFHFDVGLAAPLGLGAIVRYRGWLKPVPAARSLP